MSEPDTTDLRTGAPIHDVDLTLPGAGHWEEILNSDAQEFGGSGVGNFGGVGTDANGNTRLVLPPLGVLWLRHRAGRHQDRRKLPAEHA